MEYTRLGNTGLKVSRLALGCMSYGDPTTPNAHPWALTEDEAQPFFRQAVELGVTFWDTANVYQLGTSEEIVGRAITRYSRREDIVLATKVRGKDARRPRRRRPVAQGDPRTGRRVARPGSAPTTSTCTRSTASTRTRRSRRRWRRCTTSSRRARCATSAPRRCTRGSSRSCSTPPTSAAGRGSCRCRTSTTCCAGTTNPS